MDGEKTITSFQKTPLTSSYLVAFIVSDFQFKGKTGEDGFEQRVFAEPPEIEKAYFGVDEGDKVLRAIASYLQVNFSLPKMDQAAIPDFNAGGLNLLFFFVNRSAP